MTTPPSSPVLVSSVIAALQIAADDSQTPSTRVPPVLAAALDFSDTNKRPPSYQSSGGTHSGPNSPIKKHPDLRQSPRCRVNVASGGSHAMDIEESLFYEHFLSQQSPSTAQSNLRANRISLSPSGVLVLTQPTEAVQPPAPVPAPTRIVPPSKKNLKKKKAPASKPLDTNKSHILTYLRPDVFDGKCFGLKHKEWSVYDRETMKKSEKAFRRQILFNFAEQRGVVKRNMAIQRLELRQRTRTLIKRMGSIRIASLTLGQSVGIRWK
ncbi:hypothetical protein ACHAXN_000573 [Cyclotella atomus]